MFNPHGPFTMPGYAGRADGLDGQCQLTLSGTSLLLSPYNGNRIWVGGGVVHIPSDGFTLTAAGVANSQLYRIYLGPDGLEWSTAAYETDNATGLKVKFGRPEYRLVGLARTTSGGAWADSATQRFVRSYFNEPKKTLLNAFSTSATGVTGTSYVELQAGARVEFVSWSGESVYVGVCGQAENNNAGSVTSTSIGFDGTTASDAFSGAASINANSKISVSCSTTNSALSEGYHYATVLGKVNAGSATWEGSGTAGIRTVINGILLGSH